jgi:hypothetical protein
VTRAPVPLRNVTWADGTALTLRWDEAPETRTFYSLWHARIIRDGREVGHLVLARSALLGDRYFAAPCNGEQRTIRTVTDLRKAVEP